MSEDQGEKTIKATPYKRSKSKEDGNLPRSREFANLMSFIFSFVFFWVFGGAGVTMLGQMLKNHLARIADFQVNINTLSTVFWELVLSAALIVSPFFIMLMIVSIGFSIIFQGGWNFTLKPFGFKVNKFNPIKGLKRIFFSAQSMANFLRSFLIVAIITAIAWQSLEEIFPQLYGLQMMPIDMALSFTFNFIFMSLLKLAFLFLLLALADLAWTKYSYEKKLKMTLQEFQDEMKNTEGDPKIKRRIRTVQFQMHRRRMMASVPEADVVVTNPIHLAIALRYDTENAVAPEVLAKGQGYLAEKIKSIATDSDVPIVENQALAQALYKTCEVGEGIPPNLYKAVAEVLAYVYKLKGRIPA